MHAPVTIAGTGCTAFALHPGRTFEGLAEEAVRAALADAGDVPPPDFVAFASTTRRHADGGHLEGHGTLAGLLRDGTLAADAPVVNVEGACASGSVALHTAIQAVASGTARVALAVGVDKTHRPADPAFTLDLLEHGVIRSPEFLAVLREVDPSGGRLVTLKLLAARARWHARTYGSTPLQIATVAALRHYLAALDAPPEEPLTPEDVLAAAPLHVAPPLTMPMCSTVVDGAAAAVVSRGPGAVRVAACVLRTGGAASPEGLMDGRFAARLWTLELGPAHVEVAEIHDATAFCELLHLEQLGVVAPGEAGPRAAHGWTSPGGPLPVNASGGMVGRGHSPAATGLAMVHALARQLRGRAGLRQVTPGGRLPRAALAYNVGGLRGWEAAVRCATVLVGP